MKCWSALFGLVACTAALSLAEARAATAFSLQADDEALYFAFRVVVEG